MMLSVMQSNFLCLSYLNPHFKITYHSVSFNLSGFKIEGIKWYEKPIKTLGVYFGNNKEECEKLNWENKIDKMNTLFFSWEKHPKVSISLNAIYISSLDVQNKVVSSASCDILML
jgi:hypothetical protein